MKIVVAGGTGFLGKTVVDLLRQNGNHDVFSMSRREGVDITNYPPFAKQLTKARPDLLINCAANVGGIAYNALHPVEVFEDNVAIGLNIVKACNEAGVKNLINIMPNCVYPGHLQEYEESKFWDGPIHESVVTYGAPRKMLWAASFAYCQKHPNFKPVHLIFPNMYGPNDHFEIIRSHALGALIGKIVNAEEKNQKTVEIWGTGRPIREWLFVEDGAEAILKVIDHFDAFDANEIMNVGVKKGISIKDLSLLIKDAVGWKGEFVFNLEKPDGAMKKVLVAEKMKEKLNWEPATKLEDGILKTVTWFKKHKHDYGT